MEILPCLVLQSGGASGADQRMAAPPDCADNKHRSGKTKFQGFTMFKAFEALMFVHELSVVSSQAKRKAMKVTMYCKMGNLVALAIQNVNRALRKLF